MNKKMIAALVILSFLLTGLVVFLIWFYLRPLSQVLAIQTTPSLTPIHAMPVSGKVDATVVPQNKAGVCGFQGPMIIMNLGLSTELENRPLTADSIRMVKIDAGKKKATVFTLPRDLLLNTPSLSERYQIHQSPLGDIYTAVYHAEANSTDPSQAGYKSTLAVAQTIYANFGVAADHYISMDNDVMWKSIDTLGGITVDVRKDFKAWDGKPYDGLVIPKGKQQLNGLQTHAYYVTRNAAEEEWERTERQNAIFTGLYHKVTSTDALTRIPALYELFQQKIVTDLSPAQIASLTCLAREISLNAIRLDEISANEIVIQQDDAFLLKNFDATKKRMKQILLEK